MNFTDSKYNWTWSLCEKEVISMGLSIFWTPAAMGKSVNSPRKELSEKTVIHMKKQSIYCFSPLLLHLKQTGNCSIPFWVRADIHRAHACMSLFSGVQLCVTPQTAALQAPLSLWFSGQEYWSELLCPPPGDFPNPGIKPGSPALQVDSSFTEPPGKPVHRAFFMLTMKSWACVFLIETM